VSRKPLSGNDNGQGMVEFALVFPLLVILIIGIFEVGRVMFSYSVAIAAAREAARYGAAVQDIGGGIPQYEDCQGIRDAATRFGKFAGITDADITIQYGDGSVIYSTSCPPSQEVGLTDSISVTINTAISPITPMGSFTSIPVTSSSSRTILRKIRLGESGTGAGSLTGLASDVNFKTTTQSAEETKGIIVAEIELNQIATDLVTIPFSVTGTAFEGVDYTITNSPVYINPGNTTTTIYITLINDAIVEGNETLFIGINTPTNATKGPQDIHMITIVDPPLVSFAIADCLKLEAETITGLNIVLSKASTQDVTVPIVSVGTATWGVDYQTNPSTVVIPAGSISSLLNVIIYDDQIDEDNEIAVLGLGAPSNAVLGGIPLHLMTIVDNDAPTEVTFFTANQVVSEEIGTFTTQVTLSSISSKAVVVPYSISGTTIPADYIIHNPSPLIFPPGTQTVDVNMSILEGDGWEVDETLIFTLGSPTNAIVGNPGAQTIVITESSGLPDVYFSTGAQSTTEGNHFVDVYMQLSNAWSSDVSIQYSLSGNATNGSGQDYLLASNTLVIPVGFTQGVVRVEVFDDVLDEITEQIVLSIGIVVNGFVGSPNVHNISLIDNDSSPEVDFALTLVDKLESAGQFSVTITMNTPATQDVTVPLILSGSASNGGDYSLSTSTLTIPVGAISTSFDISINDDAQFEPEETIIVDLGSPTNAVLGSNTRFTVRIEDDELPLCEVGTHMLTIGTDSLTWSITNQGEELIFKGGSITWIDSGVNTPRLIEIRFSGNVIDSVNVKPPLYSYTSLESFFELETTTVQYSFGGNLGIGQHVLLGNFANVSDGTPCSLTESFQTH